MAGQAHHFLTYAPSMDPPQELPYAQDRYRNEVGRLYRVLDNRLADRAFVAGEAFTIADMAIWPWTQNWEGQQQTLDDKPNFARWLNAVSARPAVKRGKAVGEELRNRQQTDEERAASNKILFDQKG
jgi:GST-like protein